jgi:hypothetical protein
MTKTTGIYDEVYVTRPLVWGRGVRTMWETDNRIEWTRKHDDVVKAVTGLGFPGELGDQVARQLGSPKAMDRMLAYLYNVKPRSAELIVDEMLAICSDVDRWKDKKAAEEANARYNEILNYGLGGDEE